MRTGTQNVIFQARLQDPCDPLSVASDSSLHDRIVDALRAIYDPEIPVNIYDLGLIYEIRISEDDVVDVKMTLTAPGCPVAGTLPGQVENAIKAVPGVKDAHLELVWDPPWDKDRMSDEAKLTLGLF